MAFTPTDGINFNQGGQILQNPANGNIGIQTGTPTIPGRAFDFGADGSLGNYQNPIERIVALNGSVENAPLNDTDIANKAYVDSVAGGGANVATKQYVDDALESRATPALVDTKIANALATPAWIAPTLQNGWTNRGNTPNWAQSVAGYRKRNDGTVELTGLVTTGTLNTSIFTLPPGYRPANQKSFCVNAAANGDSVAFIKIQPNGQVVLTGGAASLVFLTGVRFPLD